MFALKPHHIKRACYTGSAVTNVKLRLVAGFFYSKMAGLICISHNYECYRKQMQVFEAALVCICHVLLMLQLLSRRSLINTGRTISFSKIIGAIIYLRCFEIFFCLSLGPSAPLIPDGIRGPTEAFPHTSAAAPPFKPQLRCTGQTFQQSWRVAGDDAPCGGPQACGQGHRRSSSQSTQVRKPQHSRLN